MSGQIQSNSPPTNLQALNILTFLNTFEELFYNFDLQYILYPKNLKNMKSKAILISAVVVTIMWYVMGGLWYGALNLNASHSIAPGIMKEVPIHGILILGIFIVAYLFVIIYSKWARGVHNASHGFQFGALLGILYGVGVGLINYSTSNLIDLPGMLIEGVYQILQYGLGGAVTALLLNQYGDKDA